MRRLILIAFVLCAIPAVAEAAELFFEPVPEHTGPGFTVRAVLRLDHGVNALEGVIRFDADAVSVSRLNAAPSGTPLWITEPAADASGSIAFSGIFPGGLEPRLTDRIALMELSFAGLRTGPSRLRFEGVHVFLNEPQPREDAVRTVPLTVILDESDIGRPDVPADSSPPEPFSVAVSPDVPRLAVFSARDTGSGIAGYELRERLLGLFASGWTTGSSPHELSARWRWSILEVRATDYAGNARTARLIPGSLIALYAILAVVAVLVIGAAARWRR
jgi:hypothetical protein